VPVQVRDAKFVQLINTALLPPGSDKPEQYRFLESDINAHCRVTDACVRTT